MSKRKQAQTPMEKLTENYERFIKGKEVVKNSKERFDKVIKKATKPKQRGSK